MQENVKSLKEVLYLKQIFRKGIIGFLAAAVLILSLPGAAVFADEMQPEEPAAAAAYEAGTAGEAREDIADDNTEPGLPAEEADSGGAAQPADQADSIEVPADQAGSAETAQPADETAGGDEMLSAEAETAGSGDPAPAVEAVEEKPYRSAAAVNPKAAIEDLSGTSSSFTVRVTDIPAGQTGTVYIPVWCAADQSDIHWYQAEKSGNDYILHVSISDHSYLTGIYKIHVYQKQDNGSLSFLTSTTADLSVKYSRLTAAAPASDGSVEISLKGFKAYGTVSSVSAAVWSAENDQDDIKWYDLTGKSTAYSGTINVNDHKGYGKYYVHLYYRSKSGKMVFVGSTEFNREGPSVSAINAAVSGTSFTVTVSGVTAPAGVAKVLIPIWAKSDQSDIIWYEAQKSGSDYVVTSDITKHRYTTGKYNAHVYVKDTEGNQYYLGKTAFTTELSYSTLQAEDTSGNESAYTVTLAGAGAWSSSSSLRCAVWSAADGQDDIRWYDMQGTQNSYKAAVKTADHSGTGKYYVHCYARWQNGSMSFVGNTEFTVSQEAGGTSESKGTFAKTTVSGDGMTYHVTLKGVKLSGEITKMQFAVWSQAGGQDDLIWYAASGSNGTYSVDVPIINHMTAGTYHVHVYATLKGAKQQTFVNNTDFKVASVPEDKIVIRNADTSGDEFDADVYLVRDASTVANVKVAVWCAPDQNDIIWQNAVLQSDGAYRVHVSAADHGYLFGTYNLHAYVYDASGKGTFAASASQKISGENIVVMTQISESSVVIKIIGAVVDGAAPAQIYVPTWSTEDGQDDIVWYSASGNSDGSYSVTVQRSNHSTDGEYVSHIYLYNAAGTPTLVKALSLP